MTHAGTTIKITHTYQFTRQVPDHICDALAEETTRKIPNVINDFLNMDPRFDSFEFDCNLQTKWSIINPPMSELQAQDQQNGQENGQQKTKEKTQHDHEGESDEH